VQAGYGTDVSSAVSRHPGGGFVLFSYQLARPTHIAVTGGSSQAATVGAQFYWPIEVTVTDQNGNLYAGGATVTFTAPASGASGTFANVSMPSGGASGAAPKGATTLSVQTDVGGLAWVYVIANMTPGSWVATATIDGVDAHATFALRNDQASTASSLNRTYSSPNPSGFGQAVSFSDDVVPGGGSVAPTGTVQFSVDGQAFGPAEPLTIQGTVGKAVTPAIAKLSVGTHVIKAVYSGSAAYQPSSDAIQQTVVQSATTVAVISSSGPTAHPGQPVSFSATIAAPSGAPRPTGTVQFSVDGKPFGPVVSLKATGCTSVATSPVWSSLSLGSHQVLARYSGSPGYVSSEGQFTQSVERGAPTLSISSSANPSQGGQPVTFRATLKFGGVPGSSSGNEAVQFEVDGNNLGTEVPLVNGVATSAPISSLSPGPHQIAVYAGQDGSAVLTQQVMPAPLGITTSSLPPASVGTQYYQPVAAKGGSCPYHWSVSAGNLPPGLSLQQGEVLFGTPSNAGTFDFTLQVTDSTSPTPLTAMMTYHLTVTSGAQSPAVTTVTPQAGPATGGTGLTITGTNFPTSGASVLVGGMPASDVVCPSTTSCTATTPAGSGSQDVTVVGPTGTSAPSVSDRFLYASTSGTEQYYPVTPYPVLDTSTGLGAASAPLGPASTIDVQVSGTGIGTNTVPPNAAAAVLEVTETNATEPSQLTVGPAGLPLPAAATLAFDAGQAMSVLVEVPLPAAGTVSVYNAAGSADAAADVLGHVASTSPPVTSAPGPAQSAAASAPTAFHVATVDLRAVDARIAGLDPDLTGPKRPVSPA
jgi:hypothetical protein